MQFRNALFATVGLTFALATAACAGDATSSDDDQADADLTKAASYTCTSTGAQQLGFDGAAGPGKDTPITVKVSKATAAITVFTTNGTKPKTSQVFTGKKDATQSTSSELVYGGFGIFSGTNTFKVDAAILTGAASVKASYKTANSTDDDCEDPENCGEGHPESFSNTQTMLCAKH